MAGIKETKEKLREELKHLHLKLSGMQSILSVAGATPSAWLEYGAVANEFAAKANLLAHLMNVEEPEIKMETPPELTAEIKMPENIVPPVEKNIVPPVDENIVPPIEKNTPPPEVSKPEIVQSPPAQGGKIYPDLKSFIGLNEKIMFVRFLFNASGTDYENAIASLNACSSWKDAEAILQQLSSSRNWSLKSEPVEVFYSLVKRRFT
jgi:hypothetical protein